MNWYTLSKLAQIWNSPSLEDSDFRDQIRTIYELSYKYQMIKSQPWTGMPERRINILKQIENTMVPFTDHVTDILQITFEKWLSQHAITDAEEWARARIVESFEIYSEKEVLDMALGEYRERFNTNRNLPIWNEIDTSVMISKISDKIRENPESSAFSTALRHYIEEALQYADQEVDEDLYDTEKEYYKEVEKAEKSIRQTSFEDYYELATGGASNSLSSFSEFVESIEQYINMDSASMEIYQDHVFPEWYSNFEDNAELDKKISVIRANAEQGLQLINSLKNAPIEKMIVDLNRIINIVHVSGGMLQYIDEYSVGDEDIGPYDQIDDFLSEMSNMNTSIMDQELRTVGVQM